MPATKPTIAAKPFLKWAGGKGQILNEIKKNYPAKLGKEINKYAEPFVGGGAVLFDVLNNFALEEVYISDINRELIHTYTTLRDNANGLIELLQSYQEAYLPTCTEERKVFYYEKRARFNMLKINADMSIELSALFIFLNHTCFNGLYRVNAKDGFNVPQGRYKNPRICNSDNLLAVSQKLRHAKIVCGDYKMAFDFIDSKTFAYFDPPYRPLSQTAYFTAYAQGGFDDAAQLELATFINHISKKGAHIVASNSDHDFFDTLYEAYTITRIQAGRSINSNGKRRGKVGELLIVNNQ